MENISRNLEKDLKKYKIPSQAKRHHRWKLLLIRDDGRVMPVLWFKAVLVWLIITALVSTCLSFILFYNNQSNSRKIVDLQLALKKSEERLKTFSTDKTPHLASLLASRTPLPGEKAPVSKPRTDKAKTPERPVPKKPDSPQLPEKSADTQRPANNSPKAQTRTANPSANALTKKTDSLPPIKKNLIDVTDLVVSQRLKQKIVRFKFVIRNENKLEASVSGYIFLILKYKGARESQWITIPAVSLASGKPYKIENGQYFKIANYKTVTFKLQQQDNLDQYDQATIIIYNENKEMMFEKHFAIAIKALEKNNVGDENAGDQSDDDIDEDEDDNPQKEDNLNSSPNGQLGNIFNEDMKKKVLSDQQATSPLDDKNGVHKAVNEISKTTSAPLAKPPVDSVKTNVIPRTTEMGKSQEGPKSQSQKRLQH